MKMIFGIVSIIPIVFCGCRRELVIPDRVYLSADDTLLISMVHTNVDDAKIKEYESVMASLRQTVLNQNKQIDSLYKVIIGLKETVISQVDSVTDAIEERDSYIAKLVECEKESIRKKN